jgi:hypothetical protein
VPAEKEGAIGTCRATHYSFAAAITTRHAIYVEKQFGTLATLGGDPPDIAKTFPTFVKALLQVAIAPTYGFWLANDAHETWGCQFTNAPLGFCFHAQTCSV